MSTPSRRSQSASPLALFAGLFDDAAVFPPGSYPVDVALQRRFERAATVDARYVGSLLAPPALIDRILQEVHPVTVVVIGRPGADLDEVLGSADAVAQDSTHALAGVQLARQGGWEKIIGLGVPVAVELPAGDYERGLDSLVPHRFQVLAKLRTGATPNNDVPSCAQLAAFIVACHEREVSFKLTGGMHHAISHGAGDEREFGFLNVLAAVNAVLDGVTAVDLAAILDEREAARVLEHVGRIDDGRAHDVRNLFQSYGCCDVDDPIRDLRTLGLIEENL